MQAIEGDCVKVERALELVVYRHCGTSPRECVDLLVATGTAIPETAKGAGKAIGVKSGIGLTSTDAVNFNSRMPPRHSAYHGEV